VAQTGLHQATSQAAVCRALQVHSCYFLACDLQTAVWWLLLLLLPLLLLKQGCRHNRNAALQEAKGQVHVSG
jgi:hypothetical protein